MLTPKVSVIIPCYGVEKYLDRCMESVVNQTLQEIEIILVDDGSPDRVPEMCDEYARHDSRVKVIHKPNAGLGYARNSGLEIATGEYVAFVDSDDYIDTRMYEELYEKAKASDCDAVLCGFNIESIHGVWTKSSEVKEYVVWRGQQVADFMLDMVASAPKVAMERKYYMSVWHAIYRRKIITDNGIKFLSERDVASEDIPFQVDFFKQSRIVAYLNNNYYYYCSNDTSLTATYKSEKYDRFKTLHYILKEKLKSYSGSNDRVNRFFIGYTRTQLHHLMLSDKSDKLSEIKRIVNDPIWTQLSIEYPVRNFTRPDLRMMYWMIAYKHYRLLYINSIMVNKLRSIKSRF